MARDPAEELKFVKGFQNDFMADRDAGIVAALVRSDGEGDRITLHSLELGPADAVALANTLLTRASRQIRTAPDAIQWAEQLGAIEAALAALGIEDPGQVS